jgi:type I site-specific restriction-modification system R (restriction) subunit
MKANYSYQITAADKVFEMAISKKYLAAILAAAPSAGKSTIIIHILNKFFKLNPKFRAVILAHNLNNLKEQMLEGFTEGHVVPEFTFGEVGQDVQVQVGVISGGMKIIGNVDIVIFDECHQFYLESMANVILDVLNPEYVVGMTGTPSYFNAFNKATAGRKFGMHYISAEELVDMNVFSNVVVDVAHGDELQERLNNAFMKAHINKMDLTKIIVAVKNQTEAVLVGEMLTKRGRKVAVCTSTHDPKNVKLKAYKNGELDALVMVNKAVLGFSDVMTTGMFDLKNSSNLDARYQLFARILRKHPADVKKFYISAVKASGHNKEVRTLQATMNIMMKANFSTYTL